jgi:hypothetical protein
VKGKGTGFLVLGVFLLFIGLILVAIPFTWEYTDMRSISDDWSGSIYYGYYKSYDEGDMVVITGEITGIYPIHDDELNDRGLYHLYEIDHVYDHGIFSRKKIGDIGDEISVPIELKYYTIDGYGYWAWKVTSDGGYHVAGGIILMVSTVIIGIGVWKRHDYNKKGAYISKVSYYPPLPQQAPPTSTQGRPALYSPSVGQQSPLQHWEGQPMVNNPHQPQYGVQYTPQTYPVTYNNPSPHNRTQYVDQEPLISFNNAQQKPALHPPAPSHQPTYSTLQPQQPTKHLNHGSSTVYSNSPQYKTGSSGRKQLKVKQPTQDKSQNISKKSTVATKDVKKAVNNCKFCGAKLVSKATFCIMCGKKQPTSSKSTKKQTDKSTSNCRYCGAELTPEALFCIMCGKRRSTGTPSQNNTVGRVTTHHTWSPPFSSQPGYQSVP